jgi:hypothetical protein
VLAGAARDAAVVLVCAARDAAVVLVCVGRILAVVTIPRVASTTPHTVSHPASHPRASYSPSPHTVQAAHTHAATSYSRPNSHGTHAAARPKNSPANASHDHAPIRGLYTQPKRTL